MEDKGNNPKGIILLLIALSLSLLTVYGALSLCLSEDITTWGYQDPPISLTNVRGTIYDRNGKILAIQIPQYGFSLKIGKEKAQQIAALINPYIEYGPVETAVLINDGLEFFPLSSEYSSPSVEFFSLTIAESGLSDHLTFSEKEVRVYPYSVADSTQGYAPLPSRGKGGVEEMFNETLKAIPEKGKTMVQGESVTLTLDVEIQTILEEVFLDMGLQGDAAIYSEKGYILAYRGKERDEVTSNVVRFINSQVTKERAITLPSFMVDAVNIGGYLVWHEGGQTVELAEEIRKTMEKSGKL